VSPAALPVPALPTPDCALCPRLAAFRAENRTRLPAYRNAPVPPFGGFDAQLLIVGLAPGLHGANRTGRPFTGDGAGKVLYPALVAAGLAAGPYAERADDGLRLLGTRITNAARCVPPANKPLPAEVRACNPFLAAEMAAMPSLRVVLAFGSIAHDAVLVALGQKRSRFAFVHGACHAVRPGLSLFDCYHCSRLNINTGRLTVAMLADVLDQVRKIVS